MFRFVVLCAVLALALPASATELNLLLPQTVDAFRQGFWLDGNLTTEADNKLHVKGVKAEECVVGLYIVPTFEGQSADIWIARMTDEAEARHQTELMVHKIFTSPDPPSKDTGTLQHNGITVYRFMNEGQTNVVFCVEDRVYWVRCPHRRDAVFLKALLG